MGKVYNLPTSILVVRGEKLIKYAVLDWLSRNVGKVIFEEDPTIPIHRGVGWTIGFNYRFANQYSSHKILPWIRFEDTVDESIILYFLLRFGESDEHKSL